MMEKKLYRKLMGNVLGTRLWVLIVCAVLLPNGSPEAIGVTLLSVAALVQVFPYWFLDRGWSAWENDREAD